MDVNALRIDRSATTKQRRRRSSGRGWIWLLALVLLAAAVVLAFRDPLLATLDRWRLPEVRIETVVRAHPASVGAISGISANGHIVAARRAALSADTPGRIVEISVTEGSVVQKGEVVARLFADEYAAALRRAEAEVAVAEASAKSTKAASDAAVNEIARREREVEARRADLRRAEADALLVRGRYQRAAALEREDAGSRASATDAEAVLAAADAAIVSATTAIAVAEALVVDARHRAAGASAEVVSAEARVEAASAGAALAKATLEKTIVRAPFDGVVVLKDAEVGEVVSPNSFGSANARGAVCTMVDFASLEVQADLPETSLSKVVVDAAATIFLDAYPERPYAGKVSRIWPTADRQQATIEVRVRFEAPDERLRPEMGVRVVFGTGTGAGADATTQPPADDAPPPILLDETALITEAGAQGVFVVERDVALFRKIRVGERRAGRVTVLEGLSEGQRVVISPPPRLADGDRVRLLRT